MSVFNMVQVTVSIFNKYVRITVKALCHFNSPVYNLHLPTYSIYPYGNAWLTVDLYHVLFE